MTRSVPHRRQALAAIGGAVLAGAGLPSRAQSDWMPPGPVRIVIPFPPGGTADIIARFVAPAMSEKLGQPFVVENRPGATGSIASNYAFSAPANGTVLLMGITDSLSIWPHVSRSRLDVTRFVPVSGLGTSGYVLLGRPDLPAANFQELLGLMRRGGVRYASAGIGSGPHMMMVALAQAAGISDLLHVPYSGMALALQALVGQQIDVMLVAVGGATQYRSTLRFYGVTSGDRVAAIPDIPTLTEQGLRVVGEAWFGVLAPPETPAAATAVLERAFSEVTARPEYNSKLRELGMSPLRLSQAEFGRYVLEEFRKWGDLVRAADIKVE